VFDAFRPASRPTSFQQVILDDSEEVRVQYVVAGNRSGKSQLGARKMAWALAENKPGYVRPAHWGTGTLQFLVIGRVSKQVEEVLFRKLRAFFKEGELHEQRVGNMLQKVVHRPTGNILLFASHHNSTEAQEKVQAYELNGIWMDEMPSSWKLIEELQRRLQDRRGWFFASFTPKTTNLEIRRMVDQSQRPLAAVYKLRMFDNPIYTDEDKSQILQSLEGMPETYRKCILEGDWMDSDLAAYHVPDSALVKMPADYSTTWRHVEWADPALQSKHGCVVAAEHPKTGLWYVVRARYFTGIPVPSDLVTAVQSSLRGLNIVRRTCDSAATWYIGEAAAMGTHYGTPWDKNNRRSEMMKGLQKALGVRLFITEDCADLVDELGSMQWSENQADRIVNSHKYHLHDCCIYGWDCIPKPEVAQVSVPELHVRLRIKMEQDRKAAANPQPKSAVGVNRILKPYRIQRRSRAW
jgi:hypothetical protein